MTVRLIEYPGYEHVMTYAGCVIEPGCDFGLGVKVGYNTVIEEGVKVGSHVRIFHLCNITAGAIIEDDVFIGPGVIMSNTNKISHGRSLEYTGHRAPPIIRQGARIGSNVTILPGVVIGREALVGAGSVVTKHCVAFGVYIGSPAKWTKEVPGRERLHIG